MQAGDPGLKADEQGRLRNRALARWLIAVGPAWPQPGSQPMSAELVYDGRACAAITDADGQVLALYPVSGSGERRRLYQAVPVTASQPLAPPPKARADLAALRARSRESHAVSSAQAARSRALCDASVRLCARARGSCARFHRPGSARGCFNVREARFRGA